MAGQIILCPKTLTISGGIGSVSTTTDNGFQSWKYGGILRSIYVQSPDIRDTFDFQILSPNGYPAYDKPGETGILTDNEANLTIRGTHTIRIFNASRDGTYHMEFGFEVGRE